MGRLRIVGGEFGGRRIHVPSNPSVRPTAARVREALFDILGGAVGGARVLDAFCGSGALGLEALSRAAAKVVFVEFDRSVITVLRRNLSELGLTDRGLVVVADAILALERIRPHGPFDLVFADPPYRTGLAERFVGLAAESPWLAPGGTLVVERAAREPVASAGPGACAFRRSARYGDTRLDFYSVAPHPGSNAPLA